MIVGNNIFVERRLIQNINVLRKIAELYNR